MVKWSLKNCSIINGIVLVNLKKKLDFSGHVYFESASPENIFRALSFLEQKNKPYKDVNINIENKTAELWKLDENEIIT